MPSVFILQTIFTETIIHTLNTCQEHHWDIRTTNGPNSKHYDWKPSIFHVIFMMPILLLPNSTQNTTTENEKGIIKFK